MNKIEIEGKLDRVSLVELIDDGYTTYDIAVNYELTEDVILECSDLLDKEVLIQGLDFSEDFLKKAIELEYFDIDDIKELTMATYSNLSFHSLIKSIDKSLALIKDHKFLSSITLV